MPELPEVETYRQKLEKNLKGKVIDEVIVSSDKLVLTGHSKSFIRKVLLGAKIKSCKRKGKYLWFETNHNQCPVFHLGMTGSYLILDKLPEEKAKSVKLILEMSDGKFMVFKDPRRFGRVFFLEDPLTKSPLKNLGPDALRELPKQEKLADIYSSRKSPIKSLLLDQSLISGIGNWMADEILFQSGIDPHRSANALSSREFKKLHQKIDSVTKLAVKVGADDEKYPKDWIFHHRWTRKNPRISSGEKIKFDKIGGRTTAWIPKKQK